VLKLNDILCLNNRTAEVSEIVSKLSAEGTSHVFTLNEDRSTGLKTYVHVESGEIFTTTMSDPEKAYERYRTVVYGSANDIAKKMTNEVIVVLLQRYIGKQVKANCQACIIEDPSQKHHSCLTQSWSDSVEEYFEAGHEQLEESLILGAFLAVRADTQDDNGMEDRIGLPCNYVTDKSELKEIVSAANIPVSIQNGVNTYMNLCVLF
jgi:hypothetical protein